VIHCAIFGPKACECFDLMAQQALRGGGRISVASVLPPRGRAAVPANAPGIGPRRSPAGPACRPPPVRWTPRSPQHRWEGGLANAQSPGRPSAVPLPQRDEAQVAQFREPPTTEGAGAARLCLAQRMPQARGPRTAPRWRSQRQSALIRVTVQTVGSRSPPGSPGKRLLCQQAALAARERRRAVEAAPIAPPSTR